MIVSTDPKPEFLNLSKTEIREALDLLERSPISDEVARLLAAHTNNLAAYIRQCASVPHLFTSQPQSAIEEVVQELVLHILHGITQQHEHHT